MRIIWLCVVLLGFSSNGFAESDLETDDKFFNSSGPDEEDDLDRLHRKNDLAKSREQQQKTEVKVKDEFSTIKPGVMSSTEARMMDEQVMAENKRRQQAILNKLASTSGLVHQCVTKDPKQFQGTQATVMWMIGADGRILETAIKSTDIENMDIQKCIYEVASSLKFDEARTEFLLKKSHVEYTYKFKKKINKAASAKKPSRRTASQ